jgi:uncharacterized protein (TIGR03000 family)
VNPAPTVAPAEPVNQTAEIDVKLPRPDATVWVDGNQMSAGSGAFRSFVSPALQPGSTYTYRITAAWMEDGQEVRMERTVPVAAGRRSLVDFTTAKTGPRMPPVQE